MRFRSKFPASRSGLDHVPSPFDDLELGLKVFEESLIILERLMSQDHALTIDGADLDVVGYGLDRLADFEQLAIERVVADGDVAPNAALERALVDDHSVRADQISQH